MYLCKHLRALGIVVVLQACTAEAPHINEPQVSLNITTPVAKSSTGLSLEELQVEPPQSTTSSVVTVDQAQYIQIKFIAEMAYPDAQGQLMIDVLEQDYAYLVLQLLDGEGRPVGGAVPKINIDGHSRVLDMFEAEAGRMSNSEGMFEFAVIGGAMNVDRLTARVGKAEAHLMINVISLDRAGFANPAEIEGALPWQTLAEATLRYDDEGTLLARFSKTLKDLDGRRVKLAGFMLPLEAQVKQKHFLLTSMPPTCFFHPPGGPTGAVEIFADEGIEASWDLLVLEGQLKTLGSSEQGIFYQLHGVQSVAHYGHSQQTGS